MHTVGTSEQGLTTEELRELGAALRERVPFDHHADLRLPHRDPVAILEAQNSTREPDLVEVRMQRLLTDAFAFFRGTAALMATDLTATASTGLVVLADGFGIV